MRRGENGWLALQCTQEEETTTLLCLTISNADGEPLEAAQVDMPEIGFHGRSGDDGKVYIFTEIPAGCRAQISHPDYETCHIEVESTSPLLAVTLYPPEKPELPMGSTLDNWPLFERIALAEKQRPIPAIEYDMIGKTVRSIPRTAFTPERLLKELAELPAEGGEIYLPAGRIILKQGLALRSNVRLIGTAGATALVFREVLYPFTILGTQEQPVNHVRLENLRIIQQDVNVFCAAILASHCADLHLENLEINAPPALGMLFTDQVYNTTLNHCRVAHAGMGGYMFMREVHGTVMRHCVAENCSQSGLFLTDMVLPEGVDALDFDGQIHHTLEVIGNFGPFDPVDPTPTHTRLQNCIFRGNRKMGITTDGTGYLEVLDCVIADNECEGITIDNGSWHCRIANCHIHNNGRRGRQEGIELDMDFVDEMGLLEDGTSKAKLPGISLDNAAYTRIENNLIENNWGDGIKMVRASYASLIKGNHIAHNNRGANDRFHFFGVLIGFAERQHPRQSDFPSCDNRVEDNRIIGAHYAGVHLLGNTRNNRVENNQINGFTCMAVEDHNPEGNSVKQTGS